MSEENPQASINMAGFNFSGPAAMGKELAQLHIAAEQAKATAQADLATSIVRMIDRQMTDFNTSVSAVSDVAVLMVKQKMEHQKEMHMLHFAERHARVKESGYYDEDDDGITVEALEVPGGSVHVVDGELRYVPHVPVEE